MGTVLRLHKEADNNIVDWTGRANGVYGSDVIEQIVDPSGARADKEITSIPSPFARIDLAKSAFDKVATSKDLDGSTIYHKLVSDCLDIGEIFFDYDKLSDKVDIIVWDKEKELSRLKSSLIEEHQILGQTIEMYLDQDADAYNFKDLKKIYLLNYKGPERPADMNIIGATSPRTLFFSSANNLSYCSNYLKASGKDKPFDTTFCPLYKRDFNYQRYLYALVKAYGEDNFAHNFPEFNKYLKESLRHLTDKQKDELDKIDETTIKEYPVLSFGSNEVEVIGLKLHKCIALDPLGSLDSDFEIDSKLCSGRKPLVLPILEGNKYSDLKYIQDNWQNQNHAPYLDNNPLESRTLPHSADKYPYLTLGDFLTPYVTVVPYELTESFFGGNATDKTKSFLLPLKDTFFQYFTPEDLMGKTSDGKNIIDMRCLGNDSVAVTLRIPIKNGRYVEYERTYYNNRPANEKENEGGVVEKKFGLGVLPLVDFTSINANPYYRIAFFSRSKNGKLSFFGKSNSQVKEHVIRREAGGICSIESYVLEENFNRIFIDIDGVRNVAIPIFKKYGTATQFTFAVDFGTTNTHVEYATDGSTASHPFDIKATGQQMQRMHKDYGMEKDIEVAFADSFIPKTVGDNDEYSFPMRTAFSEHIQIDYRKQTNSMADGNIPFRYEKASIPPYNRVKTDLKWSNGQYERVEIYLDNMFLLMRNKVILNGGGLENTKIIWFYPVSMTKARCNMFSDIWKKLYKKYFGENIHDNLIMMSESVAPYYYYKHRQGAKSNVVTIDIGGGTTDVFVVEDNKPKMLSSFRFAANSIFGDGYNFPASGNGFVKTFKSEIIGILEANGLGDLQNAFKEIETQENSNDVIAFFFSLSGNKSIRDKNIPIDFLDKLAKNDRLKYVFIMFYGSILYYVANMLKAKGLEMPQTLAFSGNGSKTLNVISTNNETIADFAALIFEKVFETKYTGTRLDVLFEDEPKLATCKGGIAMKDNLSFDDIENLKTSLLGTDSTSFTDGNRYSEIGRSEIEKVSNSVAECIDFLFKINDENKHFFVNSLAADASKVNNVKSICMKDLSEYTKQGFDRKIEELKSWGASDDAEIEETMFFYPIVAMLSNLARKIS